MSKIVDIILALLPNVPVTKSCLRPMGSVPASSRVKSVRFEIRIVLKVWGREVKLAKTGGLTSALVYSKLLAVYHELPAAEKT
jgi:hypothetical protein